MLLKLAFDGTDYHGFQVQNGQRTVCGVFQQVLWKLLGSSADIKGCSRTDRGVHATGFCLSFKTEKAFDLRKLPLALNSSLPEDIRVLKAMQVPEDFHARYSALGKEYVYRILNSHVDSPFERKYYYRVSEPLSRENMDIRAEYFMGAHDFSSFMASGSGITDRTRTVKYVSIARDGQLITFKIRADGFLYNMVRIMAGTLIEAGEEKIPPEEIKAIIEKRDRSCAGFTAPANGLFLTKVFYGFDF